MFSIDCRNETVVKIRGLCDDSVLMSDSPRWRGAAAELILDYETDLYDYYKRKLSDTGEKVWTFWNTVFYCGTIYTTIGKYNIFSHVGSSF